MTELSIVIPVYNEELNIEILYDEIINSIHNIKYEIIFIDDGSTDKSLQNIKKLINKNHYVKVLKNPKNYGQSKSMYNGIKIASSNNIVTIDSDLQNDPKDISKLYEIYKSNNNNCLVSGIRLKRKDDIIKKISSLFANKIRSMYLNDKCSDTGCSLKVFPKSAFLKFDYFNGMHRFIPALFVGFGYPVFYENVNHRHRIHGKTKYGIFNRIFINIKNMIHVKKIITNKNRGL